jgi:DNA adenine methylase
MLPAKATTANACSSAGDFERLGEQLSGICGRFILSINDTPLARQVFDRFAIERVETTYTISTAMGGGGVRAGELIVFG